jgi:hypothetical protein
MGVVSNLGSAAAFDRTMTTPRSEPTIRTGWWDFAVRAFALLTTPRADITRCDREVEALARDSVVGRSVHALSLLIRRAWSGSTARASIETMEAVLVPSNAAEQWRVGGWMVAIAGATALVLMPFGTASAGPLIWIAPAVLVAAGLLVMTCASLFARAAADHRRRSSPSSTQ